MPYTYLLINISCIIIPFIFSFYKKHAFYKEWKYFIPANLITAFFFIVWDSWFTKMGVWGFNPDYLTGIYIFNLPLEEVLFFICIPYACVFTHFAFQWLFSKKLIQSIKSNNLVATSLLVVTGAATLYFHENIYTFITALCLFVTLLGTLLKKKNINFIALSYAAITPFFFISNGILTGSFIEKPIVWYNNSENLGIRMFTIPVEDIFYGFLLILLNIIIYDYLKAKAAKKVAN